MEQVGYAWVQKNKEGKEVLIKIVLANEDGSVKDDPQYIIWLDNFDELRKKGSFKDKKSVPVYLSVPFRNSGN